MISNSIDIEIREIEERACELNMEIHMVNYVEHDEYSFACIEFVDTRLTCWLQKVKHNACMYNVQLKRTAQSQYNTVESVYVCLSMFEALDYIKQHGGKYNDNTDFSIDVNHQFNMMHYFELNKSNVDEYEA